MCYYNLFHLNLTNHDTTNSDICMGPGTSIEQSQHLWFATVDMKSIKEPFQDGWSKQCSVIRNPHTPHKNVGLAVCSLGYIQLTHGILKTFLP